MKHLRIVAVAKATNDTTPGDQISRILGQIFSFVTDIIETKGKSNIAPTE